MNIHQLSVTYLPEQDRFLARINSKDGAELRLWLTRRLILALLPALRKTAGDQLSAQAAKVDPAAPPDAQRQQVVENFQKEAAALAGDFKTPYAAKDDAVLPLGVEPLLVTEVKMTLMKSGTLQLELIEKLPKQTRNVNVAMQAQLTQGLLQLLNQGLEKSQWLKPPSQELSVGVTGPVTEGDETAAAIDKPKYLN